MSEDCLAGEECIGIRSCTAVVQQLQRAKATQDATKRNEIIQAVRDKVGKTYNSFKAGLRKVKFRFAERGKSDGCVVLQSSRSPCRPLRRL